MARLGGRDGGSIGIVLDIGVPLNYQPGAQLVLVEEREDGREPGDEPNF